MKQFIRVSAVTPKVHIGNVTKNCEEIMNAYKKLASYFPEIHSIPFNFHAIVGSAVQ